MLASISRQITNPQGQLDAADSRSGSSEGVSKELEMRLDSLTAKRALPENPAIAQALLEQEYTKCRIAEAAAAKTVEGLAQFKEGLASL